MIRRMTRTIATGFAAAAVAGFLAASQFAAAPAPADGPKHLTIVSSLPRTGSANSQTTSIVNGIKMAIEERGGKVDGLEIRYEDLVADPVGSLASAYERLGLGGFEALRPALEDQARSMKHYRTNPYRHGPGIVAEVARRWRPFIDRYGYDVPVC